MSKQIFRNKAIVSPSFNGHANGVNFIALNENGDTGQSVPFNIPHTLGSETIVNGEFTTDTSWTKGTGWTIDVGDSNTADCDGTQTSTTALYQTVFAPTAGNSYLIEFDVVSITAGWVSGAIGDVVAAEKTTAGTYSEIVVADSAQYMRVYGNTDFVGTIDNVTIKQLTNPNSYLTILPKADGVHKTLGNSVDGGSSKEGTINGTFDTDTIWDKGIDWIIANGVATQPAGRAEAISQISDFELKIGMLVNISYDVTEKIGGFFYPYVGGSIQNTDQRDTGVGSYSFNVQINTLNSQLVGVYGGNTPYGSIDNISVKEILPISTKYNQDKSCANIFTTDVPVLDADRIICDADELAVFKLVKGDLTTGLSFAASNVKNLWLGNNVGAYEQDLLVDVVQLITNGTFPTNVDSWTETFVTKTHDTTIFTDGGIKLVVANDTPNEGVVQQLSGLTIGKEYTVTCDAYAVGTNISVNTAVLSIEQAPTVGSTSDQVTAEDVIQSLSVTFTASATTQDIYLLTLNRGVSWGKVGDTVYFDNVSLLDADSVKIQAYTSNCRDYFKNLDTKGPNRLLIEEDATGRAIAVREDYSVNLKNPQGKNVGIGFKPNLAKYSMLEVVSGELQNFGGDITDNPNDTSIWAVYGTNTIVQDGTAVKITYVDSTFGGYIFFTSANLSTTENFKANTNYRILIKMKVNQGSISAEIDAGVVTSNSNNVTSTEYIIVEMIIAGEGGNPLLRVNGMNTGDIIWLEVLLIEELTTKTQKEEFRFLTHEKEAYVNNQIINGDFATNITSWGYRISSNTISFDNGNIKTTMAIGYTGYGYVRQDSSESVTINVVVGSTYKLSFDAVFINAKSLYPQIRVLGGTMTYSEEGTIATPVDGSYEFTFIALETGVLDFFAINNYTLDTGSESTINYDNITFEEVAQEDILRTNHVLQPTPVLPDPNVFMDPNGIAKLGYPDTIDAQHGNFIVFTSVKDEAQQLAIIQDLGFVL